MAVEDLDVSPAAICDFTGLRGGLLVLVFGPVAFGASNPAEGEFK